MNTNGQSGGAGAGYIREEWLGHPKGLFILFMTEMWERFSYYGMRAILVLFITASVLDGGLGWTSAEALSLYGNYTMFVYLASIPGGILADRYLGQKKSVMLGGGLLVLGHGVMAIPTLWAFYAALVLIVLGVGCLKPNISTMVGGLYQQGDPRRDKGFTIFYIGINIGAFLAGIAVASVAATWGWHAGFGLAGIGMFFGQIMYIWGQKYLVGVGDYVKAEKVKSADGHDHEKPLTKVEKDRIVVLLISFLIVIVFWGAFEQAGGLMNLYAQYKTDRFIDLFNFTVPAGWFQSLNSMYIIFLGTAVATFWAARAMKGKESSTLMKMGIGTIIMGVGFLFMSAAAVENQISPDGKSMMLWLFLAYLFHTIGELCVSPTALSFITKLSPVKYASIMMGVYFAATGLGNKVAGTLGEFATVEPIKMEVTYQELQQFAPSTNLDELGYFVQDVRVVEEGGQITLQTLENNVDLYELFDFNEGGKERLNEMVREVESEEGKDSDVIGLVFTINPKDSQEKAEEALEEETTEVKPMDADKETIDPNTQYEGIVIVEEVQNQQQLHIFNVIAAFSVGFGLLLLLFFKKLKKLTHGAEDIDPSIREERKKKAMQA